MWLIYLITILDNLQCISMVLSLLGLFGTIITGVAYLIDKDDARNSSVIKLKKIKHYISFYICTNSSICS